MWRTTFLLWTQVTLVEGTGCRELAAASQKPESHVQCFHGATMLMASPVSFATSWLTSEDYFFYSDGFLVKAQAEMSNYRLHSACVHTYIHTLNWLFDTSSKCFFPVLPQLLPVVFFSCSLLAAFNSFILCFLPAWTDSLGRWEGGGKVTCTQHPTLATH